MNDTDIEKGIKIDLEYLFKESKLEFWSVILFLLLSLAASLLRLLQKRRQNVDRRPSDEIDGNARGAEEGARQRSEDDERGEGGDEGNQAGGRRPYAEFRRTIGRVSWRW